MSNYIKIPLANNPGRSFVTGAVDGPFTWASSTGTITAGAASASQDIVGGSGSGATATVAAASTALGGLTVTIVGTGEGYKVNDIVTIAAYTGGSATKWTETLQFTVAAADLVASSGSATEPFFLMPIDNVGAVVKGSATTCIVELKQANATGTGADKVAKYTITMDDIPSTTDLALQADVAAAVIKAASAENAQPEVKFTSGAECLTVVLS